MGNKMHHFFQAGCGLGHKMHQFIQAGCGLGHKMHQSIQAGCSFGHKMHHFFRAGCDLGHKMHQIFQAGCRLVLKMHPPGKAYSAPTPNITHHKCHSNYPKRINPEMAAERRGSRQIYYAKIQKKTKNERKLCHYQDCRCCPFNNTKDGQHSCNQPHHQCTHKSEKKCPSVPLLY